ncbi:hypothetical protein MKZ38_002878 [Zalerion maritima]|uniref:Uncharacterized protein n=1 Tax=Zalerion maritima TaxID=339359 RepID=A0AAD5RZ57_9PEZI|nr:hypothetical protein MKZ38_002878 [Zalerion maritima]
MSSGNSTEHDRGLFIPEDYVYTTVDELDMNIASIFWGFSLACAVFAGMKAVNQTIAGWKRRGRVSTYIVLVWGEWFSSVAMGIISWLFLRGIIEDSFWFFFFLVLTWSIQIQCLLQIIINRISLLMMVKTLGHRLKWGVFVAILCINVSVFCIWVPARLQISETIIRMNEIWDRVEKVVFLIIDAGLNIMFIYLVNSKLIANGLTKYRMLFKFNCIMVFVSISLDVVLIGTMSLPNGFVYLQFHPLAYLTKLYIEMNMADLIRKVVRASNNEPGSSTNGTSRLAGPKSHSNHDSRKGKMLSAFFTGPRRDSVRGGNRVEIGVGEETARNSDHSSFPMTGIQKTVVTEVRSKALEEGEEEEEEEEEDGGGGSETSSTRHLKKRDPGAEGGSNGGRDDGSRGPSLGRSRSGPSHTETRDAAARDNTATTTVTFV